MASDVEKAFTVLSAKQAAYRELFNYYDGDQPLMYTARRLEEIFRGLDARFTQNWCAVVVDAVKDRINLRKIAVTGSQAAQWADLWERSELFLESDDCHEALLVAGEGFVIVDNDGQAYYNDPRLAQVFYDAANPRLKRWAAKWWVNDEGFLRMALYYPDRVLNYVSVKAADKTDLKATDIVEMAGNDFMQANPLGQVPVFHFRQSRRIVKSDLKSVLPIQNGINKLLSDMMVAAEFGAFKQRWVISNAEIQGKLKNAPGEVWDIPSGDGMGQQTQVGQFEANELKNYLNGIEQAANACASITRTPKHYFFSIGSNLSGEALMAMEAPLVKKAQDRIDRAAPVWKAVAELMLFAVSGVMPAPGDVKPEFDGTGVVQPRTEAETRGLNVQAGMPLETVLRDEGKSVEYIEQMQRDRAADAKRQQVSLGQSLLDAQRRFDIGGQNNGHSQPQ